MTEALALLEESVADPAGIDRIARDVLGLRMGPFELMDLTGLDVTAAVIDSIWEGFRYADRLRPSYLTPNRVAAGLHGRKTGHGWFAYGSDAPSAAPEPPVTGDADRPVYVVGDAADFDAATLREALAAAGATVETGAEPSSDALVLVPVWGTTVAAAVGAYRLPAGRTFGVDPLPPAGRRRVLAVTAAADPAAARDARAVLARAAEDDGEPYAVSVVRDTAGSVAQRLLASIVSVAASIAERSSPPRPTSIWPSRPVSAIRWGRWPGATGSARTGCWNCTGRCTRRPATRATARPAGSPSAPSWAWR